MMTFLMSKPIPVKLVFVPSGTLASAVGQVQNQARGGIHS